MIFFIAMPAVILQDMHTILILFDQNQQSMVSKHNQTADNIITLKKF